MVVICVEPPSQVMTHTQLYPPVVARTQLSGITDTSYVFAMAVLLGPNGDIIEGQLGGTLVTTGVALGDSGNNRGSSSSSSSNNRGSSFYFIFPDFHMSWSGTYSIRIDVYYVDYLDPSGAQLLEQVETRDISVYDEEVAADKPCKMCL